MERKIILCTTFREFDNSANSKIQTLFLDSIKRQKYSNYKLVITTFDEKTVKPVILKEFPNNALILNEHLDNYRYSLSTVFLNGLNEAKKYSDSIVLWCTCDIILNENYFETVNRLYAADIVGTTHPNIIAYSIDDFYNGLNKWQDIDRGFDILFFSTELLKLPAIQEMLMKYYFYEWGVFEHFLLGIAIMYSKNMYNLINCADVVKIENDRKASKEPSEYLQKCHERNYKILLKCVEETEMSRKVRDLWYCHTKFKTLKWSAKYIWYTISQSCVHIVKKIINKINYLSKKIIKRQHI